MIYFALKEINEAIGKKIAKFNADNAICPGTLDGSCPICRRRPRCSDLQMYSAYVDGITEGVSVMSEFSFTD